MIFPVALTHSVRRHLLLLPFLCLEGDGVPQSPPSTLKRLGRAAGTKPRPPSRRGWEAVGGGRAGRAQRDWREPVGLLREKCGYRTVHLCLLTWRLLRLEI